MARGGLPEEGVFDRDLSDEEGPFMCRSRRGRRHTATACAKALRQGLLFGFSNRKETGEAGLELESEKVMGGEEGDTSRGPACAGPWQRVRLYYKCHQTQRRFSGSINNLEQEPGFHRSPLKGSVDRIQVGP